MRVVSNLVDLGSGQSGWWSVASRSSLVLGTFGFGVLQVAGSWVWVNSGVWIKLGFDLFTVRASRIWVYLNSKFNWVQLFIRVVCRFGLSINWFKAG